MNKEKYFTTENIEFVAKEIYNSLCKKYRIREIDLLHKTALLVLDMQDYFLFENSHAFIPSALSIIPNVQKLINHFYNKNLTVIFTKHIDVQNNTGMMGNWWNNIITKENPLSETTGLLGYSHSNIVEKTQYDAFYRTNLLEILNNHQIRQIIVTGVMTHLCCESTIRSAFTNGFNVLFPIDATATYTKELHLSSFNSLTHGFATPLLTNDFFVQTGAGNEY